MKDIKERLNKVVEILSSPQDSDEVWWCVGELERIVEELEVSSAP